MITSPSLVAVLATGKWIDIYDSTDISFVKQVPIDGKAFDVLNGEPSEILCSSNSKSWIQRCSWYNPSLQKTSYLQASPELLSVSPDSKHLAGTTHSDGVGILWIWDLLTGEIVAKFDAHLGPITCIAWTKCGAFLISGGEDSKIHCWSLFSMLNPQLHDTKEIVPYRSWFDHFSPVTDLAIGYGRGAYSTIISSSKDRTVRVFSLGKEVALHTYKLPSIVNCIDVNPQGTDVYCGCKDASIYKLCLLSHDTSDVQTESKQQSKLPVFFGHTRAVTDVKVMASARKIATISEDRTLKLWDLNSRQLLKSSSIKSESGHYTQIRVLENFIEWYHGKMLKQINIQAGAQKKNLWNPLKKHYMGSNKQEQSITAVSSRK